MSKTNTLYQRRRARTRAKLRKHAAPGSLRLSVFRSNQHIHVQLINDVESRTIAAASTLDKDLKKKLKKTSTIDAAKAVGTLIAERAKKAKVSTVVFDRGGYEYHGRVRALAEAAREAGLKF